MKCDECGGNLVKKTKPYIFLGQTIGRFNFLVCNKCGQELTEGPEFDKIEKALKRKHLWGLSAQTKVGRSGHSLSISINKKLASFLKLRKGETIFLHPETREKLIVERR